MHREAASAGRQDACQLAVVASLPLPLGLFPRSEISGTMRGVSTSPLCVTLTDVRHPAANWTDRSAV